MNLDILKEHVFPVVAQEYSRRDSILYALGLGYGGDPLAERELRYLFEERLKAVPSMCMVLGQMKFWAREPIFGIDWVKVLHAEQSFEMLRSLEPQGSILGRHRIVAVEDKGKEKGALVYQEKELVDAHSGAVIARVRSTLFLRGDGGCGSFGEPAAAPGEISGGAPDRTMTIATLPQQALIYRLSGDWNPIHAEPAIARNAGFDRPILHGLCTMGIACRALLNTYAQDETASLESMAVRFSRPVYPGESLAVEFFEREAGIRFRVRAVERDLIVLDRGHAILN